MSPPRTLRRAVILPTVTLAVVLLAVACSDSSSDTTTAAPAADPADDRTPPGPLPEEPARDAGTRDAAPDAGPDGSPPVMPTSFDVTGTARVSCTFKGLLPPAHTVCSIEPLTIQLQPGMAGTLDEHVIIQASTAKELQFTEGLALKSPAPSTCLAHLGLTSTAFVLTVSSLTAGKTACGAPAGGVEVADFGDAFEVETPAIYYPVSKKSFGYDVTLKVKLTLVP